MPNLGSLFYTLGIKDMTEADLQKVNTRLKNLGFDIQLTPKILKDLTQSAVPRGIKIELDPTIKNEALARAVEGKAMRIAVTPLLAGFREAIIRATRENPPLAEIGVQEGRLRTIIQNVLNRQGFMLNVSTVNDNYSRAIQARLNGTRYNVKIHADANEITRSVQASLMQVQSRYFGLKVSRDILYRSIDEALGQRKFPITVYVKTENARSAVQTALNRMSGMGAQDVLSYQRLMKAEAAAAAAELNRVKAAHMGAADAAKAHATASINLGGAMGSNIKIAGELGSAMTSLYSIHAAKEFLSQVIEIGGELEHQKIAMDTIFGDKGKTNELYGQIKGLARQSPFGVMELTKSVKALSAYGVQYNEIYDTAKRLADISAATSVDINRLILAFGKTKSRGFLDGLEAKQFAYANIPIYEMVRKKLEELEGQAVTTQEVMERMRKREISFDIVKDVLWDITDPGGKFYDMQEALAGSVKTSWKLVRDNIELMFGEIAEGAVGNSLKSLAEILQGLTREWRAMGMAIGAAAISFGVYRVAVAASNQMMGTANALSIQKAIASNKVAAANAMEASSYRALTPEEDRAILAKSGLAKLNRSLLLSHRALTQAEWDGVLASKAVNSDYILRRIALGRLTQAEIDYLVSIEAINAEEARIAARAQGLKVSLASLWASAKTGAISAWVATKGFFTNFKAGMISTAASVRTFKFASFTTSIKTAFVNALSWVKALPSRIAHAEISVTRLKVAFAGLGRVISSIGAFLLNPATIAMAAIGGLAYAWQKNNEQMEKAKEIGDNIFTKATEGADNLKQTLKDIKPSHGLSNHQLTQGIEQMEQAIKDYSPQPLQDINDTLVAQDGHVLTLAERYDALKKKVEEVKAAYDMMGEGDVGTMVSDAIKSTGGFLNDTVTVNAKDYSASLKKRDELVKNLVREDSKMVHSIVAAAEAADKSFETAVANMKGDAQKLAELVRGVGDSDIYGDAFNAVKKASNGVFNTLLNAGDISSDKEKFKADVEAQIADITASIKTKWDVEISQLSDNQKDALAISLRNMLDQADGVSEEVKMEWAQLLEDAFGITIIEDKIGPALQGTLKTAVNGATDASIIAVVDKWKNEGWSALSEAERKIVTDMMTDAKDRVMVDLGKTQQEMQDYISQHPLTQTIELVYSDVQASEYQKELWKSSPKLSGLLSDSIKGPVKNRGELTPAAKKRREWYNTWTRDSKGDYETRNRIKQDLEADYNEILASKNRSQEYRKTLQDEFDAKKELAEAMGHGDIVLKALKSNKSGSKGSEKDPLAESLKHRVDVLKKAYAEYKKELAIMSKDEALVKIKEAGIFDELFTGEDAITDFDSYEATLEKLLADAEASLDGLSEKDSRFKGRHDLVISLRTLLNLEIPHDKAKEALDKAKREIDEIVSRTTKNWELFKQLYEATGEREWSMDAAFGNRQYFDETSNALVDILNKKIKEKGLSLDVPFTETVENARELFGNGNEELFNLWKSIRERATNAGVDAWKEEAKAMQEYLREYGTFQQRRLAIEQEYAIKIQEARKKGNEAEANLLSRQKNSKIQQVEVDAIKQTVDWGSVFGGFGAMFEDQLEATIDKLKTITRSEDFKKGSYQEQKVVFDLIAKLEQSATSWDKTIFKDLAADLTSYQAAMRKYIAAQDEEREAAEKFKRAREALTKAEENGAPEPMLKNLEKEISNAKAEFDEAANSVAEFGENVQEVSGKLQSTATQTLNQFNTFASSISGLASGSLKGIGEGLMGLDKLFNNSAITKAVGGGLAKLFGGTKVGEQLTQALGDAGFIGQIISAILSILDILKDGIGPIMSSLLDSILGAVSGIINNILSGDLFKQVGKSLFNGVKGIFGGIASLGGHFKWWQGGDSDKNLARDRERLINSNETLKSSIDSLAEVVDRAKTARAIEVSGLQFESLASMEANLREILSRRGRHYKSDNMFGNGGHDSVDKKIYYNLSNDSRKALKDMFGITFARGVSPSDEKYGAAQLWGLSPEEWETLKNELPGVYDELLRISRTGYDGDIDEDIEAYIDLARQKREIEEGINERLTNVSFSSVADEFKSLLLDMDSSAQDFADNFEKMMQSAIMNSLMADKYNDRLRKWYDDFAAAAKSDEKLTGGEIDSLRETWDKIVADGLAERDALKAALGWTGNGSKNGLSAGIQGVTEDTADLLASYLNATRADVSEQTHVLWPKLLNEALPQMNIIAESQLRVQGQIAENTLRSAKAAEAIMKSNNEISGLLTRVTQGGAKFYVL